MKTKGNSCTVGHFKKKIESVDLSIFISSWTERDRVVIQRREKKTHRKEPREIPNHRLKDGSDGNIQLEADC
jgi:hypothetical protein